MNIWADGTLTIVTMLVISIEESMSAKPSETELNLETFKGHHGHINGRALANNCEENVAKEHAMNSFIKGARIYADKSKDDNNQHVVHVRNIVDMTDKHVDKHNHQLELKDNAIEEIRLNAAASKVIDHGPLKRVAREIDDGKRGKAPKDDEYTYEYETVEDEHPPTTTTTTTTTTEKTWVDKIPVTRRRKTSKTTLKSSRKSKSVPSTMQTRPRHNLYTIDSAVVDMLQEKKKKSDMTSRDREMAKRNLQRRLKSSTWRTDQSEEEHDTSGRDKNYVEMAKFDKIKKKEAELHEEEDLNNAKKDHGKTVNNGTVDKGMGVAEGGAEGGANDDEYTYEYETIEDSKKRKKTSREISKELFEKQLADYHAQKVSRRKYLFPDESKYIDPVKVEGVNIKDIKDDTNETLANYDEHGNLRWKKEWEHLKPKWTEATTTPYNPYESADSELNEKKSESLLKEDEKEEEKEEKSDWVEEHAQSRFEAKMKEWGMDDGTRSPQAQELHDLIDNLKVRDVEGINTVYMTGDDAAPIPTSAKASDKAAKEDEKTAKEDDKAAKASDHQFETGDLDGVDHVDRFLRQNEKLSVTKGAVKGGFGHNMDSFQKQMDNIYKTSTTGTTRLSSGGKREKTISPLMRRRITLFPLTTRSPAEREERAARRSEYKRRLHAMRDQREKHKNLFLKLRGFEKYTEAPRESESGGEDSFDREYLYLKSEKAFRRWLKFNQYRFPKLNPEKRQHYEILLKCWDTDIKKIRKGQSIVTLYPPPSTFQSMERTRTTHYMEYELMGLTPQDQVTYKDSLEEAFYRRYNELKENRTFQSLEKIIEEKEGRNYKPPQLDLTEFNKRFWNVLLKEEHRDYERKAVEKQRFNRLQDLRDKHRQSIEGVASLYERQRWIRQQIKKHLETKSTTIDRKVELDEEGREWFKGVRGITGDLPDEFFLDDKTDLPRHLRWRVELPEKDKKRKVEKEKNREMELVSQGLLSTTSDPLAIYKRLFKPLELPEWKMGLTSTTTQPCTLVTTTETEHWFYSKYAKYFTSDNVDELKRAYEGVPKKYLTQWMNEYCPNLTDFYRIPDDYDPPEWQAKREEYIKNRRRKIKVTQTPAMSGEFYTPYSYENFTYPTMTITWDWVGPNQTMYFGLLARAKDKVADRVVLDSEYLDQMWDKTDSKLGRFDVPQYQCLRCNKTFEDTEELNDHHREHLNYERLVQQHRIVNGSYTKRKKTVPPNKSYLFYYYSDAENVKSDNMFQPDYPKYG